MELSIITTFLSKTVGSIFARILVSKLLTDHVDMTYLESIGISVSDLAGDVAGNVDITELVRRATADDSKSIRNANYLFETIGEEAAETLAEVFRHEGNTMPEAEWQEAIEAAKVTLNEQAMSLLLESKLDAHHFARALQRVKSTQPLSAAQEALYTRILGTSAQVIFAVADSVPHFTRDTTAMLLQNVESLSRRMRVALATQERILDQTYGGKMASLGQQFESEYRTLIGSSLNKLELFGIDNFDGAKQPLSVAYVRLMVDLRRSKDSIKQLTASKRFVEQTMALTIEYALSTGNRLLIVSEAGSGKTTLLKWVAVQAAELAFDSPLAHWQGHVPFFVRLRDFAQHYLPEYDTLASSLRKLKPLAASAPDHWTVEILREGRALVLLDGMDEVSNEKRQEALTWIENLLLLYPDNVVIVSSRPSGLNDINIQQGFQQLAFHQIRLLPMNREQVTRFIEQWHEAMGSEYCRYPDKALLPEKCDDLLTTLGSREELQNLAKSPILCAMLCALNLFELGSLPQDRIRLYDRCIDILLRRDENRKVDSSNYRASLRLENVRRRLASIAYWMMKNDPSLIHRHDAERLLAAEGLAPTDVLDFLAGRSVIFRAQSTDEFDFIHRTFVEYLAAHEIVRSHEVGIVARTYGNQSEWYETIRLLAGHVEPNDQADLLRGLYDLTKSSSEQWRTLHFLAWTFWDLLDFPRNSDAITVMSDHVVSLNLHGANALDLSNTQISDASTLVGLSQLQHLALMNTQVSDVSTLAGLSKLQHLNLWGTQVSDVSALVELSQLHHLYLSYTRVSDVSTLAGLSKLQYLDLRSTPLFNAFTLAGLSQLQHLHLSRTKVSNVSALAGLNQLQHLNLSRTKVSDVSALAGMSQLQRLDLRSTEVSDVSPLAGLSQLQHLGLSLTQVSDISPLSELNQLQRLDLHSTEVSDVSTLAGLSQLQYLDLSETEVSDVSALVKLNQLTIQLLTQQLSKLKGLDFIFGLSLRFAGLSELSNLAKLIKLKYLYIHGAWVSDISVLSELKGIQYLGIHSKQVSDVLALESLSQLQHLDLGGTRITQISALKELHQLQHLDLSRTLVEDVSALESLNQLQHLGLVGARVNNISALAELSKLQYLDLRSTQVDDVSALVGLSALQHLDLRSTQVNDVSVLAELSALQHLDLRSTQVSDVSALAGLSALQDLDLCSTQVSDVSVLAELHNLKKLYLQGSQVRDVSALREALPDLVIYS